MAKKKKMTAATKKTLADYKSGKKKKMSKAALSRKMRALAKKRPRHKSGPKKGQFKKGR